MLTRSLVSLRELEDIDFLFIGVFISRRKGNCKNTTLGMKCEVGLRRKTYNVLTGSVLSVWVQVEQVLTHDGNKRGANSKMQVRYYSFMF